MPPKISIVVPLFNEEKTFSKLIERLNILIASFSETIEIVLVDDGSKDSTARLMQEISFKNENYTSVFLSRNFGHPIAVSAGISNASADEAIMIIDGDLQDPPELLIRFYTYLQQGYDVVYAIRKNRKEGFLKRIAYHTFYRLLKKISTIDIPLDSGDFSLISRKVADILISMPEENRYLRGMRSWVGFNQIGVEYERSERFAGESKYTLKKLFQLAYSGIFNFSEFPIKLITRLGITTILISVIYFLIALYKLIFENNVPVGFTGLLFTIILFGGITLISIGILGEYIIRIFYQVKNRPLFIIKNKIVRKQVNN